MAEKWRSDKIRQKRKDVQPLVDQLDWFFKAQGVEVYFGGSWRRGMQEVGDLDVLLVSPSGSMEPTLNSPGITLPGEITLERRGAQIAQGNFTLPNGVVFHVDFWVCKPNELGAFLLFITGPKELNVSQRARAKAMGFSLSQIGLLDAKTKVQLDNGTEEDVYRLLHMPYLRPEQRQVWKNATPSKRIEKIKSTDGQREYLLTYHSDHIECTCPGFVYRGYCKHSTKAEAKWRTANG